MIGLLTEIAFKFEHCCKKNQNYGIQFEEEKKLASTKFYIFDSSVFPP